MITFDTKWPEKSVFGTVGAGDGDPIDVRKRVLHHRFVAADSSEVASLELVAPVVGPHHR